MRIGNASGSALVELAVCIPVLVFLTVGAVDFARVFYTGMELTNAARAGAQFGAHSLAQSGNIAGMQSAATGAVNLTGVSASASRICYCTPVNGSSFSPISCAGLTESVSCPRAVVTVSVTATRTFNLLAPYPGLSNSFSVQRSATLRVAN
jgi:Flp pilus assembly protein TadG